MLTKGHLKFRIRNGRAVPQFLPPTDPAALALAEDLLELFRGAEGRAVGEIEEAAAELGDGDLAAAFRKLLLDQTDTEEDDGQIAARRWQLLLKAEALRRQAPPPTPADFQQTMGDAGATLYADLPACRRLRSFTDMNAESLIHRYNCAQVQGLLLRAESVTVKLVGSDLGSRRELFRQLKFHRLMGGVEQLGGKKGGIAVTLSGPLTLFDQATTYGLRYGELKTLVRNSLEYAFLPGESLWLDAAP